MSRILSLVPLLTLAACGDHMQVGSVYIKSGTIGAAGGGLTITASDYPSLAGTSIAIPPGALASPTRVGIGVGETDVVGDGEHAAGPALVFAPIDQALAATASITIPFDPASSHAQLRVDALLDGTVRDVSSRIKHVDASLVTFELDTLGIVQANQPNGCNGTSCVDAGVDGAADGPTSTCDPNACPVGTSCPMDGTTECIAVCGTDAQGNAIVCPQGQGCDASTECVAQCGSGGVITFLCPPAQVCDFGTGTCH